MWMILSAGIAPGLALLSYFYLKDEYGYEPVSVVFKTFLFGALLVFPIMFIQHVLTVEGIFQAPITQAFIASSVLEEFFKWFILIFTIYKHVAFDEPYDGIVYGVAVSLGFATVENILYLISNGVSLAIGRALLPVSSHALFGVIMGFYIGKAKFIDRNNQRGLTYSLLFPVLLHGLYDYILITQTNWLYYMLPFMIFLWYFGLRKVKKAKLLSYQQIQKQSSEMTLHS